MPAVVLQRQNAQFTLKNAIIHRIRKPPQKITTNIGLNLPPTIWGRFDSENCRIDSIEKVGAQCGTLLS